MAIDDSHFHDPIPCGLLLGAEDPVPGTIRIGQNTNGKVYAVFREDGTQKPRMVHLVQVDLPLLIDEDEKSILLERLHRVYSYEVQDAREVQLHFHTQTEFENFIRLYHEYQD